MSTVFSVSFEKLNLVYLIPPCKFFFCLHFRVKFCFVDRNTSEASSDENKRNSQNDKFSLVGRKKRYLNGYFLVYYY